MKLNNKSFFRSFIVGWIEDRMEWDKIPLEVMWMIRRREVESGSSNNSRNMTLLLFLSFHWSLCLSVLAHYSLSTSTLKTHCSSPQTQTSHLWNSNLIKISCVIYTQYIIIKNYELQCFFDFSLLSSYRVTGWEWLLRSLHFHTGWKWLSVSPSWSEG